MASPLRRPPSRSLTAPRALPVARHDDETDPRARPLRICLIASARFPVSQPFAGGLESLTHTLTTELVARGHDVTLFAGPGSDRSLPVTTLTIPEFEPSPAAMRDANAPSQQWMAEHHAYLDLMIRLAARDTRPFDVVHNNSLHHLPVAMAHTLRSPVLTTLHTPPLPWLESAMTIAARVPHGAPAPRFVAVSESMAAAWRHVVPAEVVHNGVDVSTFVPGPGGGPAIWSGRIVPEKAPHDAILACRRAGVPLLLAGPVSDTVYFDQQVAPLLGPDATYVGHLGQRELVTLLGQASVAVVSPRWDEPYGLVAAEALACGTPVAAYDRGALREIVDAETGTLAVPGDVAGLAEAVTRSRGLDRDTARRRALAACSVSRMVDAYEATYLDLARPEVAA